MKRFISGLNKAYDVIDKINEWFIIITMCVMCIDLFAQVIARFIFSHPLTWSEELARYLFVWIALIGGAWGVRNHLHVKMTAVTKKFPPAAQRIQQIGISIVCAVTCYILLPHAITIFLKESKLVAVTLGVSLGIEYIAAPVGILLMAVAWTVNALWAMFDWNSYMERYGGEE